MNWPERMSAMPLNVTKLNLSQTISHPHTPADSTGYKPEANRKIKMLAQTTNVIASSHMFYDRVYLCLISDESVARPKAPSRLLPSLPRPPH